MPLSNTYKSMVEDELIGLDFPLETAQRIIEANLPLIEDSEFAGRRAISIAEELAENNANDKAIETMQENAVVMNAANKKAKEEFTYWQVLHGHESSETAYVVDDYPSGFKIRCRIRYWIETIPKGVKQGMQRFVSQTSHKSFNIVYTEEMKKQTKWKENPAYDPTIEHMPQYEIDLPPNVLGLECKAWNKPKYGIYIPMVVMFKDSKRFVHNTGIGSYSGPAEFEAFRNRWQVNTEYCQFTKQQLERLKELEDLSRKVNPTSWAEWLDSHNGYQGVDVAMSQVGRNL